MARRCKARLHHCEAEYTKGSGRTTSRDYRKMGGAAALEAQGVCAQRNEISKPPWMQHSLQTALSPYVHVLMQFLRNTLVYLQPFSWIACNLLVCVCATACQTKRTDRVIYRIGKSRQNMVQSMRSAEYYRI